MFSKLFVLALLLGAANATRIFITGHHNQWEKPQWWLDSHDDKDQLFAVSSNHTMDYYDQLNKHTTRSDSSGKEYSSHLLIPMSPDTGKVILGTEMFGSGCFLNASQIRGADFHPITGELMYVGKAGWTTRYTIAVMDLPTCHVEYLRADLDVSNMGYGGNEWTFDADGRFWGESHDGAEGLVQIQYWLNATAEFEICTWMRHTYSYYPSSQDDKGEAYLYGSALSTMPVFDVNKQCLLIDYKGQYWDYNGAQMGWWPGHGLLYSIGNSGHFSVLNFTYNNTNAETYDFHNKDDFWGPQKDYRRRWYGPNGWGAQNSGHPLYEGSMIYYGYGFGNWTSSGYSYFSWASSISSSFSSLNNPVHPSSYFAASGGFSDMRGIQYKFYYDICNAGSSSYAGDCKRNTYREGPFGGSYLRHRAGNTFWNLGQSRSWNGFSSMVGGFVSWLQVLRFNPIPFHDVPAVASAFYGSSNYYTIKTHPTVDMLVYTNFTGDLTGRYNGIRSMAVLKNPDFYAEVDGVRVFDDNRAIEGVSGVGASFTFGFEPECDNPWDANGCARRKMFQLTGSLTGANANRLSLAGFVDDSGDNSDWRIVEIEEPVMYHADVSCTALLGKPTMASVHVMTKFVTIDGDFELEIPFADLQEECRCQAPTCNITGMNTFECEGDGTITACSQCLPGWEGDDCATDAEDPVVVCPADVTTIINGTEQYHAVDGFRNRTAHEITFDGPVVTDNSDGLGFAATVVTASHMSGTNFSFGWNEVVYTATDHAGNVGNCTFYVIVEDNTPPMLDCPMDFVQGTDVDSEVATLSYDITVLDNVAHDAQVDNGTHILNVTLEVWANYVPGDSLSIGDHAVYISATDYSNNTATCAFVVTIADEQVPVAVCPDDVAVNTDSGFDFASGLMFEDTMLSSDNVGITDGSAMFSADETTQFPAGSNVVTFNVSDDAGNVGSCTFTVEVTDLCAGINCNSPPNDCHVTAGAHCYDGVCDYPDADFRSPCMDGISEANMTLYREFICVEGECYPDPWTYLGNGSFGAHFGPSGSIVGALMAFFALAVPAFFF